VTAPRDSASGWPLVAATVLVVSAGSIGLLAARGSDGDALRLGIRATARLSCLLFLAVYAGPALERLRPSRATVWLVRSRRSLVLSFAASHLAHALFIALLARLHPDLYHPTLAGVAGGLLGYLLLLVLVATCFDGAAAWMGPRWRGGLEAVSLHYLWFVFAFTFTGASVAVPNAAHLAMAALCIGALAVRAATSLRARVTAGA
jgi:sulfoxide reductase heme-binding subunit YedZ